MKSIYLSWKRKNVQHLNERAFTLTEALFSLSIFSIIVFFMLPMLQVMLKNIDAHANLQEMEWEVFSSQVKKEIRMCKNAEVISGRLFLTKDTETVIYEKYTSNMRRRVNSTGHEIILQNVGSISFSVLKNAVVINVKDIWGNDYSLIAYSLLNWNSGP